MILQPIRFVSSGTAATPGARASYRLLALQAGLIAALVAALGFGVAPADILVMVTLLAGVLVFATMLRRVGLRRPADALEGMVLILASGMTTACLSILLATIAPPFRDDMLARADVLLLPFLDWPAMARALSTHPAVIGAMSSIYFTLLWQPFALVLLLAVTGRTPALWRFVHAWLLALIACLAVFALVPAMSAQVHYGFAPGTIPNLAVYAGWRPADILTQVRSGALHQLASGSMTGLITFPSFHATAAILLGWGFWQAGGPWRAVVIFEAAMLLTIPLIGSHYFIDVLGGVAVAVLSLAGAGAIGRIRIPAGRRPQAGSRLTAAMEVA